jgi:hypothetical protein
MGEGSRIRSLLREPLLHFLLAGGLLFLASRFWTASDSERILVTKEIADTLAAQREEILLRPLSPEERERLVSDFVDEEVLLREAYRQGLDQGDPRIRRWLVEKMELLIDEEPKEPTAEELDRLYREEPERYSSPRAVSFDQVFYASPANIETLSGLRAGADFNRLGDEFWLGKSLNRFSELELKMSFGADFTARVMALPIGEWAGPLTSSRGVHFVRVKEIHEPELRSRKEAEWALREDWLRAKREESRKQKLAELRAKYRIEIEVR